MKQLLIILSMICGMSVTAQDYRALTTEEFMSEVLDGEGEATIINFWATWCGPCVKELPVFNDLAREHPEIRFIFVSLDMRTEALETFLGANQFEGEVWYLTNGLRDPDWIELTDPEWSGAIPATLAIDSSEGIRAFFEGEFSEEGLADWIPFELE